MTTKDSFEIDEAPTCNNLQYSLILEPVFSTCDEYFVVAYRLQKAQMEMVGCIWPWTNQDALLICTNMELNALTAFVLIIY